MKHEEATLMGDIGTDVEEIEITPIIIPAPEPVPVPVPA